MPSRDAHLNKLRRDLEAIRAFVSHPPLLNGHYEWAIVLAHYAAIHAVEALLAEKFGAHSTSHEDRDDHLHLSIDGRDCFRELRFHFSTLKKGSSQSRYLVADGNDFSRRVLPDGVISVFLNHHLAGVLRECQKFLPAGAIAPWQSIPVSKGRATPQAPPKG